jgi:hypothetical protein
VELHGDRAGLDDPAIVCGIGSMDGVSFMFIGQQKGRNTKVRRRGGGWGRPAGGRLEGPTQSKEAQGAAATATQQTAARPLTIGHARQNPCPLNAHGPSPKTCSAA